MLNIHIETRLLERTGKAVTSFEVSLPAELQTSLPSIEQIERELGDLAD